jgi:hypothetical protein
MAGLLAEIADVGNHCCVQFQVWNLGAVQDLPAAPVAPDPAGLRIADSHDRYLRGFERMECHFAQVAAPDQDCPPEHAAAPPKDSSVVVCNRMLGQPEGGPFAVLAVLHPGIAGRDNLSTPALFGSRGKWPSSSRAAGNGFMEALSLRTREWFTWEPASRSSMFVAVVNSTRQSGRQARRPRISASKVPAVPGLPMTTKLVR